MTAARPSDADDLLNWCNKTIETGGFYRDSHFACRVAREYRAKLEAKPPEGMVEALKRFLHEDPTAQWLHPNQRERLAGVLAGAFPQIGASGWPPNGEWVIDDEEEFHKYRREGWEMCREAAAKALHELMSQKFTPSWNQAIVTAYNQVNALPYPEGKL